MRWYFRLLVTLLGGAIIGFLFAAIVLAVVRLAVDVPDGSLEANLIVWPFLLLGLGAGLQDAWRYR